MSNPTNGRTAAQAYAKVFVSKCDMPIRGFIDIFHAWVSERKTEHLLIDVHDYTHVQDGPGVILVANEAHYGMDRRDGRLGLVFRAKRGQARPVEEALADAVRFARDACALLETDTKGKVTFDTSSLLVGFEDRLNAPNTPETFATLRNNLESFAKSALGENATVEHHGEAREVFGAILKASS